MTSINYDESVLVARPRTDVTDIEKYKQEISNLKSQIIQLRYFNKNNNSSTNKDIRFLNDSTNTNLDLEKYNKNLEQLVNAKKEIALLKSQIQKMENEKKSHSDTAFRENPTKSGVKNKTNRI